VIFGSPAWHAVASAPETCDRFLDTVGRQLGRGGPIRFLPKRDDPVLAWRAASTPSPSKSAGSWIG
jgi:hypothetical protein